MSAVPAPRGRPLIRLADLPPAATLLVAMVIVLAIAAPGFLSVDNALNIGRTAAILALAAAAQAIVIIVGGLDLSAASAVALMSVITVLVIDLGTAPAFAVGMLSVVGVGVLNGLLIAHFSIPAFLVTLGTFTGLYGVASTLVGGIPVEAPPTGPFSWPAAGDIGPVPVPIVLGGLGIVALSFLLRSTVIGRSWYLIGSNPEAARAAGINVRRVTFLAYVIGAVFLAVAGLILTSRVHSGQPNLQPTLAYEAIAACAIGGLSLAGGSGRASGVLAGVLIVSISANGLRLLNLSSDLQLIVIGVLTVVAVLAQRRRRGGGGPRRWTGRRRRAGPEAGDELAPRGEASA